MASRILIQAVNITDTNHEKVMVRDLRRLVREAPLNASIFHPYFVFFDQFELVLPLSVQSMVIGAVIMMFISFVFIPNFLCSFWVAFSIVSIEMGVAGYMALWDVNLDSISMINLIMCVGYSVDFTAHICYTYMASKSRDPKERVREALYSLGWPIFQGAVSTILGTIALLLAMSYIFLVFFKIIFLVIVFGALHGIFLLPVLLSLFGPGSCTEDVIVAKERALKDETMSAVEKSFPHPYCFPHPQLALAGPFGSKQFLGAPYKAYGLEEKDQGIGTSGGEDSSESSSSKSQRRQAIEDENTRRQYEDGWRRTSYSNGLSQFQPVIDLYGRDTERIWTSRNYDTYSPQLRPNGIFDTNVNEREKERRRSMKIISNNTNVMDEQPRYYDDSQVYPQRYYTEDRRRSVYERNKRRTTSHHSIYHPRPTPQRSSSQHSINELRHMGDLRFS